MSEVSQAANICPVCGYPGLIDPPRLPSGAGSFEICPCCAFHFGVTDEAQGISTAAHRGVWVRLGMRWFSPVRRPPPQWDPVAQLLSITQQAVWTYNGALRDDVIWRNPETWPVGTSRKRKKPSGSAPRKATASPRSKSKRKGRD